MFFYDFGILTNGFSLSFILYVNREYFFVNGFLYKYYKFGKDEPLLPTKEKKVPYKVPLESAGEHA